MPRQFTLLLFCLLALVAQAHCPRDTTQHYFTLSGALQSDILFPQEDAAIGAPRYSETLLTNTYADLALSSRHLDAGARFEYLQHPLPGFESGLKGWGLPFFYVKGKYKSLELTLGSLYDQFGAGFILRTYEERTLGIDNQLRGARLTLAPLNGLRLKALAGRQRHYWDTNEALIAGGDAEYSFALNSKSHLTLGASTLHKHESATTDQILLDPRHQLRLPDGVWAADVRAQLATGGWNILAEWATKGQDPSFDNQYIYRHGHVAMLSASYSHRGMSLLMQAKRSDNMGLRSRRSIHGTSSMLNHLPAFTRDQTYALQAQYPYATNPNGEWAYQVEMGYKLKRGTKLGGRYGTDLKIGFSHIHAIEHKPLSLPGYTQPTGSEGYTSAFWKWGDATYYQNIDFHVSRRLNRNFKLSLSYANMQYNQTAIEGEGGMVYADFFVAEGKYNFSPRTSLRGEVQYANVRGDQGDWLYALAELSLAPHWMISLSDKYNLGSTKQHYYLAALTYSRAAHRLQVGYGRTTDGYNCSGGVCRYTPASKGLSLSYNYSF